MQKDLLIATEKRKQVGIHTQNGLLYEENQDRMAEKLTLD